MSTDPADENRAPTERASALLRKRLKVLTKRKGTSVTKIGLNLGYSRGGLRNSLESADGPNLRVLLGLAAHLGLHSIDELFGDPGTWTFIEQIKAEAASPEPDN